MARSLMLSKLPKRWLCTWACACVLVLVGPAFAAEQTGKVLEDDWFALYLNGQKAGYQHEVITEKQGADGTLYESAVRSELAVARGGVSIRVVDDTTVTENGDGRLLSFAKSQAQGPLSLTWKGEVEGTELVVSVSAGGPATVKRVPVPEGLCPWALRKLGDKMGHEPGTKYTARAFVAEMPERPVEMSFEVTGREAVQVFEVTKWLHRTNSKMAILPHVDMTASQWADESGAIWLIRIELGPNMILEGRRTTRDLAQAADAPADILAASAIPTDKPIQAPRRLERLEALIEPVGGSTMLADIPSDAWQDVSRAGNGLRVTIRRAHGSPEKSYKLPYAGGEYADLLKPNVWLETGDPLVASMSHEAVGDATDALTAAKRIEAYVRSAIKQKGLDLGFATAAEAAKQKAGDCTEHAVLVAALARAAGIPSRVVGGLAYAERLPGAPGGGFGYHMWAEAYVGEWLPLDAALGGHDATHLVLVRSDLNQTGDLLSISAVIAQHLGGFRVRVVESSL
jgi:hypothetical protein